MSDNEEKSLLVQSSDGNETNDGNIPNVNHIKLKTKKLYERSYINFTAWQTKENLSSSSEKVLLAYFQDMSKKYSPPTLCTEFSMLKTTLHIHEKIDISRYSKLKAFLKQNSFGYKAKKSNIFSPSEINSFIDKAPDEVYLLLKTAVIFGIMGACRRQELHGLLYENVTDYNGMLLINIIKNTTEVDRTFTVTGSHYNLVKKYINLRPKNCTNKRFFVKYYKGKCTNQQIGINCFGNMGKEVASYLKLENPELYTGHCFRRTSATVLINQGGHILPLRHQGLKSTSIASSICNAMQNKCLKPSSPCQSTSRKISSSDCRSSRDSSALSENRHQISSKMSFEDVMPAKSKEKYITAYENFITWKNDRNKTSFCEEVLLLYFEEISAKYKPTSLWAIYSMLKCGLKCKHNINLGRYLQLGAFLKKLSKGYVCKKGKSLSMENMERFLDEAPDDRYLATKVALILGVTGGLRQLDLIDITTNDIENHGEVFVIKLPQSKDRSRASFVIQGKYYHIVKKYQSVRTTKSPSNRFFQQYRNGKCSAQVIGKNKFGIMSREIAEFLKLPDANTYTGHSFRKASTSGDSMRVIAERCADSINGKKHSVISLRGCVI